ncbi:MAG: ABC transporter ATP-binding protein [Oscillospiraceae bacterium]|jgi:putative ABC transport system ATP-binding protein|nr:ABC transporter ATP-binding protein [Oscillospiraceae bacterium]
MELLKLERITKKYGQSQNITALNQFNLNVREGEMLALMGKSGSGKSTVLNIISGIDGLQKGSYKFKNQEMAKVKGDKMTVFRRDNIGFILQHFALIQDATIYDNIALPLRLSRKPKAEIKERVRKLAAELGIEKQLKKYPKELSGGEAQRAAIARAIINQPQLILADEPTGALDEENSRKIMEIFQKLNAQGNTFIIVTHDPNVGAMCKRTVHIKDGKNYETGGGEINA